MKKPQGAVRHTGDGAVTENIPDDRPLPWPSNKTKGDITMSTNELTYKIKELRELQALIDEAQTEAEAIRDTIKAHMGDAEELRAGEYRVTWKPVTSARFDATAFKATHAELYRQYTRETTTRRFCVA